MKIIALDIAAKTGWCCGDTFNGGDDLTRKNHGVFDSAADCYGNLFLKFHIWFRAFIKEEKPDAVYYEDVKFFRGRGATLIWCGLISQVQLICHAEQIKTVPVDIGTIKKHATGKGNAKKDKMIEAAKNYGLNPIDDNDADAICLWYCAMGDL